MSLTSQLDLIAEETVETSDRQAKIQAVIASLKTLLEGDEQEQSESFDYLKQSLEEDRSSNRRLFQ